MMLSLMAGGKKISVQDPLPTDGDSVYEKDINVAGSVLGTFTGNIVDLFKGYTPSVDLSDTSSTNPKYFIVTFNRPIETDSIGIGSATQKLSNVKILLQDQFGADRAIVDDSSNDTKYSSNVYSFEPEVFIQAKVEFHTADEIELTGMFITKDGHVSARIEAQKPDGTAAFVGATAGSNLKISLEEFDPAFDGLPLPVVDPILHLSRGLVTGATCVNKYGMAEDGVQTTGADIWDRADAAATQPIWLAPTAARIHTITSSSVGDDGNPEGAGVGAQAVRIWYLPDWDTKETFEDVILNGVSAVVMQNAAVMINRMKVIPVGTTYAINIGIITATAAVDTTVTSQINAGNGQTRQTPYGIPSVQTAYATGYLLNSHDTANPGTAAEVEFNLLANEYPHLNPLAFIGKGNLGVISSGTTTAVRKYNPYRAIPGPVIIKVQATSTANDTEGVAEYDLILVDN